jgi:hypothetical protein
LALSAGFDVGKGLKASLLRKQGSTLCVEQAGGPQAITGLLFPQKRCTPATGLIGANPASNFFYQRLSAFIIAKNRCIFIP